jgi:hypothetical protein
VVTLPGYLHTDLQSIELIFKIVFVLGAVLVDLCMLEAIETNLKENFGQSSK